MSTRIEVVVQGCGHLILELDRDPSEGEIKAIYRDAIRRLSIVEAEKPRRPYGFGAGTSLYTDLEREEE